MSLLQQQRAESGVAVWSYTRQEFVPFFPCPGEKRVRLDVFDGLENYGVYAVEYQADGSFITADPAVELKDWELSLS